MVVATESNQVLAESSVIDAVKPSDRDKEFLKIFVSETQDYAFGKGYTDFIFQGYPKNKYFGGYKSSRKTHGKGLFIFGFVRVNKKLEFHFPASVPEPRGLSHPWTGKTKPARKVISVTENSTLEFFGYLAALAKAGIDLAYEA